MVYVYMGGWVGGWVGGWDGPSEAGEAEEIAFGTLGHGLDGVVTKTAAAVCLGGWVGGWVGG